MPTPEQQSPAAAQHALDHYPDPDVAPAAQAVLAASYRSPGGRNQPARRRTPLHHQSAQLSPEAMRMLDELVATQHASRSALVEAGVRLLHRGLVRRRDHASPRHLRVAPLYEGEGME